MNIELTQDEYDKLIFYLGVAAANPEFTKEVTEFVFKILKL